MSILDAFDSNINDDGDDDDDILDGLVSISGRIRILGGDEMLAHDLLMSGSNMLPKVVIEVRETSTPGELKMDVIGAGDTLDSLRDLSILLNIALDLLAEGAD